MLKLITLIRQLQGVIDSIVKPQIHDCNLSFQMCKLQIKIKSAEILPKKIGDGHQFRNYRPISLLSQKNSSLATWKFLYKKKTNYFLKLRIYLFHTDPQFQKSWNKKRKSTAP